MADELERVLGFGPGPQPQGDDVELSEIDLMEDAWAVDVPQEAFTTLRREAPVFWHDLRATRHPASGP